MTYEAWRISYQDSEQAARAAYRRAEELAAKLAELEQQKPVAWLYDWQAPEGLIKDWVETNRDEIQEGATSIRPLFARPAPAEPVNARLLEALIQCRDRFIFYVEHHLTNGAVVKAAENDRFVTLANQAIAEAEAQQERLLQDMHDAGREIDRVMAGADPKEPIAEQPVNTRLLTALKACRHQFAHYVAHHISKGDMHKAGTNDAMVAMADVAIMGAEAAPRVARLTMGECMQAVKHISFEEMTLFGIARAIEVAVLRKNGLEVAE